MGKAFWKLVPHMHPDHAAKAEEVRAEQKKLREEMRSFNPIASLLWPPIWDRKARIKSRLAKLDAWFEAAMAPVGYEFDPPCIGKDEKATDWYRDHLMQDPEAWPLPPEEMIEVNTGQPVWHLSDEPLLQQLDMGWVQAVMPVPTGPGFTIETMKAIDRDLTAEEAVQAADVIQTAVSDHFNREYPDLIRVTGGNLSGETADKQALERVLAQETPQQRAQRQKDAETAQETTMAILWLRLWGEKGYAFSRAVQGG